MHALVTRRTSTTAALIRTVVLALFAALAVAGLSAGPAQAEDGDVAWTVRTAANSYGDDRSSFSHGVNPGGQIKDAMVVANRSKTPLELAVYAADGYTTDMGQLDLLTKDKKSVGVGAWLKAGKDHITIKPGKTVEVPFTVEVPDNATPGDYTGGILTSLKQADDAEGINVDRRLGIRVKLRVSGELKPALAIEKLHVGYDGSFNPFAKGDATVTYTIHNTGNAVLSARQAVSVSGPFGWLSAKAADIAAPPELLPGESWKVKVPVHGVAPGVSLKATATLTPLLTDASGSISSLKAVEATTHGWAVPWTLLVLIVVIVVLIVLARRRHVRRKQREENRVQAAVEQALNDRTTQTG
ncbi:WxL protein peptidoglycan domain-containing protein [Streptomyces sp. NPDC088725]|uniref:WxL protein peptidoglycan domain-containing protein n=1 Tax=Streptomyces sp. NPDC088725 TaxID=3365873 RepID=UPI0037FEB959